MDNLKTYAKNHQEQSSLLTIVKGLCNDTKMDFGLDKCAKATLRKGKLAATENIQFDLDTIIQDLEPEVTYKYLSIHGGDTIQPTKMKQTIRIEHYRRIRLVTKSELSSTNRMEAINTLAIPVVTCSFNNVDCEIEETRRVDRKTRKILNSERMHHPSHTSDVDRLYLLRNDGHRGIQ